MSSSDTNFNLLTPPLCNHYTGKSNLSSTIKFKIGDVVYSNKDIFMPSANKVIPKGTKLIVSSITPSGHITTEVFGTRFVCFRRDDFTITKEEPKFKVGDIVKCVSGDYYGEQFCIAGYDSTTKLYFVESMFEGRSEVCFKAVEDYFEHISVINKKKNKARVEEIRRVLEYSLFMETGLDEDEWKALDEALAKVYKET